MLDYSSNFNGAYFSPITMGAGFGVLFLLGIWEFAWKGWALWKAARNNENIWFIALLLLNTAGILPILYIYVFAKDKKKK